jgi:hypothetical protein
MRGGVIVEQQLARLADAARDGLEDGLPGLERRFLRDARKLDSGRDKELPVIGASRALDDLEEARLPRAVTPDEADVLARLEDSVRMV